MIYAVIVVKAFYAVKFYLKRKICNTKIIRINRRKTNFEMRKNLAFYQHHTQILTKIYGEVYSNNQYILYYTCIIFKHLWYYIQIFVIYISISGGWKEVQWSSCCIRETDKVIIKSFWYSPVLCSWNTNNPPSLFFLFLFFLLILAPAWVSNPAGP